MPVTLSLLTLLTLLSTLHLALASTDTPTFTNAPDPTFKAPPIDALPPDASFKSSVAILGSFLAFIIFTGVFSYYMPRERWGKWWGRVRTPRGPGPQLVGLPPAYRVQDPQQDQGHGHGHEHDSSYSNYGHGHDATTATATATATDFAITVDAGPDLGDAASVVSTTATMRRNSADSECSEWKAVEAARLGEFEMDLVRSQSRRLADKDKF
ncbi:hypothetical protein EDC01DRAFT_785160 [Geopyxis carbonaria]|nr:hypothetical protein EDC01DRAFT_785160 [Geopyxis carbonaria]